MSPFWILLRHRWRRLQRSPCRNVGLFNILLVLFLGLFPLYGLGVGSYGAMNLVQQRYPNADATALVNGSMLYLVLGLILARLLFRFVRSERLDSYLPLPISKHGLLRAQFLLSLVSPHTLLALVIVGPLWSAEMGGATTTVGALAWLASALVLSIMGPALGIQGLRVLLDCRPRTGSAGLLLGVVAIGVDATTGFGLVRAASEFIFGAPVLGLVCTIVGMGGATIAVLRGMRIRLDTDRQKKRAGAPSGGYSPFDRWIEKALPAGRLVALELRQMVRTRLLQRFLPGMLPILLLGYGSYFIAAGSGASLTALEEARSGFWIVGVVAGILIYGGYSYGVLSDYAGGLFARPHSLAEIVKSRMIVLGLWVLFGLLLTTPLWPWVPLEQVIFALAFVVFLMGTFVPGLVYLGPRTRTPVDSSTTEGVSASSAAMEIGFKMGVPVGLILSVGIVVGGLFSAWSTVSGVFAGIGLLGMLNLPSTFPSFVRQLERHRREMLEGFWKNDPV